MKVIVHIVIESDAGIGETIENIIHLEHRNLHPEDLGLTLAEARTLLQSMQRTMVERQVATTWSNKDRASSAGKSDSTKVLTLLFIVNFSVGYGYGACASFTVTFGWPLPGVSVL